MTTPKERKDRIIREAACPACGAEPGDPCIADMEGRPARTMHLSRRMAWTEAHPLPPAMPPGASPGPDPPARRRSPPGPPWDRPDPIPSASAPVTPATPHTSTPRTPTPLPSVARQAYLWLRPGRLAILSGVGIVEVATHPWQSRDGQVLIMILATIGDPGSTTQVSADNLKALKGWGRDRERGFQDGFAVGLARGLARAVDLVTKAVGAGADGWRLTCMLCGLEGEGLVRFQEHAMAQHGYKHEDFRGNTGRKFGGEGDGEGTGYIYTFADGVDWLRATRVKRGAEL